MMKSFLSTINYSSCNEDSRSEYRALQITPNDSILCITGSGSRPLDLLVKYPDSITSIDFNPCQNFLLELKIRAFQLLDYEKMLKFLGICLSKNREEIYQGIRKSLTKETRQYWDSNISLLKRGVIYQGRWERYFHTMALIIGIERPTVRQRLFNAENLEEQKKIWTSEWDTTFWKLFLRVISPKMIWKLLFRDPGFYRYVPGRSYIYRYIFDCFSRAQEHFLFRASPFAVLLFFGKYTSEDVLPIYLKRENFNVIRQNVDRIQMVTESLYSFLDRLKDRPFDKYSLSDFNSYLSKEQYTENWQRILMCARKGAIVCERQWLVKRNLPDAIKNQVAILGDLEKELEKTDDSIFYTFNIVRKI